MPTLVLSRRHSQDSNAMWRAAVDAGWDVERLQSYAVPEGLAGRDVVLYGETILADAVAEPLGVTLLEPAYDWPALLPEVYRKRGIRLKSLGQVRSIQEHSFVKPVDEKIFPARVYEPGEAIDTDKIFPDDAPVLVSEPVRFGLEVRAFVREREVLAMSAYMRGGEIAMDAAGEWPLSEEEASGARQLLDLLLADPGVECPPAVVIDVGDASGLGWVVVEANACWAAGICGCDPRQVLRVIRRANVRTAELTEADRRWSRRLHVTGAC